MIHQHFPHIYCINLNSRKDRWAQCEAEFAKHGIENVHRMEAVYPDKVIPGLNKGQTGCMLSHLVLLQLAQKNGWDNILILEDDVEFANDFNEFLQFIPKDYDMLYLGGSTKYATLTPTDNPAIKKVENLLCTHAYVVSKSAYQILIDEIQKWANPIDVVYSKMQVQLNALCFIPKIAWQRESHSDVVNKKVFYKSATNDPNPNNEW